MVEPATEARPAARRVAGEHGNAGVFFVLLAAIAVLCVASLLIGSVFLAPDAVWQALVHGRPATGRTGTIVWGVRVPRTLLGLLVGVALGAAGALMQGHTRNPLADPGIFGVTAGASLAVVLAIFLLEVRGPAGQVWFAMVGAAAATTVVVAIAARARGGSGPVTLALAGVAVAALLSAAISFVVLSDAPTLDTYRRWVVGSLSGRQLGVAIQVLPFIAGGLMLAAANARTLDLLGMGTDVARGLGQRVVLGRVVGLGAVSLLTAAATAAAGPIGFLGLVAPHVARKLVGTGYRRVVPCAALLGVVLLLAADVGGRFVPGGLQVGVSLALVGAPVLFVVVRRRKVLTL